MEFDGDPIGSIEAALESQRPDGWRRLREQELPKQLPLRLRAAWRICIPTGYVSCPNVDHVILGIDDAFPNSQPRIVAPQADSNFTWPHVEPAGVLCLGSTLLAADAGQRVIQHLEWAQTLLSLSDAQCIAEFAREFSAYWNQRLSKKEPILSIMSLIRAGGPSREICYFVDWSRATIVFGDERELLTAWLRHTQRNPGDKQIKRSWLLWLDAPMVPSEFPENGSDVLRRIPEESRRRVVSPGERSPILLGAETESGVVLVGVVMNGASERDLCKGFRGIWRVPPDRIMQSFASRPVQRCRVSRADGGWVHGRDHDKSYAITAAKTVALIGCGSLGASIARLLAQAGVGGFILVDPDDLEIHNTARHVLGHRFVGRNKARALAELLGEDFPHLRTVEGVKGRFDRLNSTALASIAKCDLIISAGIDVAGDFHLDQWRRGNSGAPTHICTWVEEFGIVGHAVSIFGQDSLRDGFDGDDLPRFRLTDWTGVTDTQFIEAGCGNSFQPHGAVDLQATVNLAARLALDVLAGRVAASARRVWQGDRNEVLARQGTLREGYSESNTIENALWP